MNIWNISKKKKSIKYYALQTLILISFEQLNGFIYIFSHRMLWSWPSLLFFGLRWLLPLQELNQKRRFNNQIGCEVTRQGELWTDTKTVGVLNTQHSLTNLLVYVYTFKYIGTVNNDDKSDGDDDVVVVTVLKVRV